MKPEAGIEEDCDARRPRHGFPQQLQHFGVDPGSESPQPRDVTARPCQAGDEAGAHRIAREEEHDRDRGSGVACSRRWGRSRGDDDIDLASHQFGGHAGKAFVVAFREQFVDGEVLSLDPPLFAHPCDERLPQRRRVHQPPAAEPADAGQLASRLGERQARLPASGQDADQRGSPTDAHVLFSPVMGSPRPRAAAHRIAADDQGIVRVRHFHQERLHPHRAKRLLVVWPNALPAGVSRSTNSPMRRTLPAVVPFAHEAVSNELT